MKNLIAIALLFVATYGTAQNESITKIAVATYDGLSTEGYYFTNDLDESSMLFVKVRPEALKKYDLKDHQYIRETFRVTYNVEKVNGKNLLTIIDLEQLDYNTEDDGEKG